MWAILAAPLMISDDLTTITPESESAVSNREVIAIDQDRAGIQGTLLASEGEGQIWVKPLADRSRAVALLNRGVTPATLHTNAQAIGMPALDTYTLHNLWTGATEITTGEISAEVAPESTVLLRVFTAA
jgi:alpha-galactosidase